MPSSYGNPSPPYPSFNKPTSSSFSHPTSSVFSTNSSQSQYSANMIPPRYATNFQPSPQFSNNNTTFQPQTSHPPTPAEQNFILSQTWPWVPHTKCSLLNDPNTHAVYLITLVAWDGYQKLFDLQLLTPSSSLSRSSPPEIHHNILEHQLLAPREATFHNTTSLPLRPREPLRRMPAGLSVGIRGQTLGIAVSNVEAPFQHHVHDGGMGTGSEVLYSQYNGRMNSPQQYFGDGQRKRSANDSDSEGYVSASSAYSKERSRRSDHGSRASNSSSGRDGRQKERRDSGSRDRSSSREGGRGSSERGRRGDNDRDEKRKSGFGKKDGGRKESSKHGKQGASNKKEKSGSRKKSSSRSTSMSSTEARSPKRK